MTVQMMAPDLEIRESGNTTLFDADFVVSKCTPSDEKLHRDILWVTVKDQNGDPLYQDERLETWTGWVTEGVHFFMMDGSGVPDLLEADDTIRLTGLDSRFQGGLVQIGWDKNGHEIIGDSKLPTCFFDFEAAVQPFTINSIENLTMLNLSVEKALGFEGSPNWCDIEIVVYTIQWNKIERELEPYSEPFGEGIHAWYIDCGTKPGKMSSGDIIIITGLTKNHLNARLYLVCNGSFQFVLTVPPLP